ncbi:MAG: hypothetical protein H6R26_1791 [Proteobacteria bacterium]|nr:hypothetical protein [Pseudomonadota bacterium]
MFAFNDISPLVASATISIHRPPEDVFNFIGDRFFINYPRWSPEVRELKQIGSGPVQVGTHARQVRVDLGHRSESIFAVTALEPAQRVCFTGLSSPYRCDYEIARLGSHGSTRLVFTFELPTLEMYLRPFKQVIRDAIGSGAERTVRKLKCLVESESPECGARSLPRRIPAATPEIYRTLGGASA